jgi:hypothetical protein
MNPNADLLAALGARQPMMAQHQVLTPEAKAEIARVQAMQVRTQAAAIAGNVLQGAAVTPQDFVAMARVIELYIVG